MIQNIYTNFKERERRQSKSNKRKQHSNCVTLLEYFLYLLFKRVQLARFLELDNEFSL